MKTNILKKMAWVVLLGMGLFTQVNAASPLVGYWKSVDDRTGEALSLIEIKKLVEK